MKRLFGALGILLSLTFAATATAQSNDRPGEGVTVNPAVATWESARPIEMTLRVLLEDLGYEVSDASSLANPIFYQSVVDGDVDYWGNGWFPLHNAQLPGNFDENASVAGTVIEAGALEGYLVDRATAEELGITSLEDFKRDEVKEAFDADGDGRADLVACPPGWGCEVNIEHQLDAYELRDHVNAIKADYAASFADALARFETGEPVFYYTWTPNFTVFELVPGEDVVWINVPFSSLPEESAEFEDATTVEGLDGCVTEDCNLGFPANDISIVANNDFLAANPAAASIFANVELPLNDVSEMTQRINEGEDSDEDVRAMIEEWIADNQEMVDSWLEQARTAASEAGN